jgi:CHRD domain-containing protein
MSKRVFRAVVLGAVVLIIGVGAYSVAGADSRNFAARPLIGYEESPPTSTVARGSFTARLSSNGTSLSYTLRFSGLEGTVTQSHIHFGQRGVSAGISIWLCETEGTQSPSATTPTCPAAPGGTVSGTVTAADVVGPNGQGIAPTEFGEIIRAMRSGVTYVNVHSSKFPAGEIRAQIRVVR